MLRITKQADYALVLLAHFAAEGEGAVLTARELAEAAGLPLPTVGKVLKSLARGGLLRSTRGAGGGYHLARPAEAISVAAVIGVLDGPIALTECLGHEPGTCVLEAGCPTRGPWASVNRAIRETLERLPISEMSSRVAGRALHGATRASPP
jgi:FeS assembly SUF system regulator